MTAARPRGAASAHYHAGMGTFAPLVKPGKRVDLDAHDCASSAGFENRAAALEALDKARARLEELAAKLAATRAKALLVVLQGMDGSGKDGTARAVFGGLSPLMLRSTSFKAPTSTEIAHDFLWRIHAALPQRGEIGIFNRSHYEDVLIVRVDNLVPESSWSRRYDAINAFERHLTHEGVLILKFFLNVSRDAQRDRFEERLEDPVKRWKFSPDDLRKRDQWDDYREAYRVMLEKTSTEYAPWRVVPADHNAPRNAYIAEVLVKALDDLGMEWPTLPPEVASVRIPK